MLFTSWAFIFAYLPVVFAGYFLIGKFAKHELAAAWLVAASIFFYGWWNVAYVPLLLSSILFNYVVGVVIARCHGQRSSAGWALFVGIAVDLSLLIYYKYAGFFLENLSRIPGISSHTLYIVLPIGISFFTFTQIAFLVDAWGGKVREYNFLHYLLFVTWFPHLIAGPILHHGQMMPQFRDPKTYRISSRNLAIGLFLFSVGLSKKLLLADPMGGFADPVFLAAASGTHVGLVPSWFGALAYTFQIYFDFSGYSDMALGLSMLFGVKLPINFNSPYKATNIIDFWRRWHMTLSQFLRDYLYIPLGGNRYGESRRFLNLMATMLLGGLWHGANWTFVAWGGLHGLYLCTNHLFQKLSYRFVWSTAIPRWLTVMLSTLITFAVVVVAWVFFRANSIGTAIVMLKGMAGRAETIPWATSFGTFVSPTFIGYLLVGFFAVWLLPNAYQIIAYVERRLMQKDVRLGASMVLAGVLCATLLTVALYSTFGTSVSSPFLYFQF